MQLRERNEVLFKKLDSAQNKLGQQTGSRSDLSVKLGQQTGSRRDLSVKLGQQTGSRRDLSVKLGQQTGSRSDLSVKLGQCEEDKLKVGSEMHLEIWDLSDASVHISCVCVSDLKRPC